MTFGISFSKFLLIDFWFATDVPQLSRGFLIGITIVLLVVFAGGIVCKILSANGVRPLISKRLYAKCSSLCATVSVLGLLIVFFRQYHVTLLGARFWLLLLALFAAIRVWTLIRYAKVQKTSIQELQQKETIKKYLV